MPELAAALIRRRKGSPSETPGCESASKAELGSAAGLPLFMQRRGGSERAPGIQREPEDMPAEEEEKLEEVQTKLLINRPGDVFEEEADQVAESVSEATPAPLRPSAHAEEDPVLQAKPGPSASGSGKRPPDHGFSLKPPDAGSPLNGAVRERVEPVLGADLSAVRVHTSARAQEDAAQLSARAFTHKNHIWLGAQESPDDPELLAHEATHVVQQAAGSGLPALAQRRELPESPDLPAPKEPPEAAPSPTPETAAARETQVEKARGSFAEATERTLGLGEEYLENPSPSSRGLPEPGRAKERAASALSEIENGRQQWQAGLEETSGQVAAEISGKAESAREPEAGGEPESAPGAVAAELEGEKAPVESAEVPVGEIGGAGPESATALSQLRTVENVAPELVEFGETLNFHISELRARTAGNLQQSSLRLKSEAAAQRGALRGAIGSSQAEVSDIMAGAREGAGESVAVGRETIAAQGEDAHARNAEIAEAEPARLQENIDGGAEQAQAAFTGAYAEVQAAGDREGKRGRDHAHDLASRALELGQQEAAYYRRIEEDAELGEDKAGAVLDVASGYASQLRNDGDNLQSDVAEQTAAAREQIATEEEPAVSGFATFAPDAAEGIRKFLGSVDEGIDGAVQQSATQLDSAEAGVHGEIEKLDAAASGRGEALGAEGEANLDAALTSGLLAQANLAGQAGQMLDGAGRDAILSLAAASQGAGSASGGEPVSVQRKESPPGEPAKSANGPAAAQDEALGQLEQTGPALDQAAAAQTGELIQPLGDAAARTGSVGSAWVGETQSRMDGLQSVVDGGVTQVTEGTQTNLDGMLDQSATQAGAEVDRVSGEVSGNVAKIEQSVAGGVGDATNSLQSGVNEGTQHADGLFDEVPGDMSEAAAAQEHWYTKAGHWISKQLSDTWNAFTGLFDWGFLLDLAVGIVTAIAVAALVIAAAALIGVTGGLALALVVGVAAGAAGFAAGQMSANVRHGDPIWQGVGHAALLGAFVGGAAALGTFYGLSLVAGAGVVMLGAGVGTVIANVATGREWDDHLLANIIILGIFHAVVKGVSDRLPSSRTQPVKTDVETSDYRPPPAGRPEILVDSPARVTATEFVQDPGGGWTCELFDSQTGAKYGYAEVEATPQGKPSGGPHLTIDPTNARLPNGDPVNLKSNGFSWTPESLRAAMDAFKRKFGSEPRNMDGLIAWSNLLNFQRAFARIRAANPGMSLRLVAEQAAREISFGKHRIGLGYGDISVEFGNFGDVTAPNGDVLTNVPKYVYIHAKPVLPGPVVPPPHPDDKNE